MKDHEGFLPKGWMMHEPYNLHNGTPALAIYTYLYRATRNNAWQGSLQTLADIVEIPCRTVRANLSMLQSRGLVYIEPLAYSHYTIKAQRLTSDETEVCSSGKVVGSSGKVVGISGKEVGISGTPIKDNINIKENIKKTNVSSRSIEAEPAAAPAPSFDFLDRKSYIIKVLANSVPQYPFSVVYEYAALVNISREIVDDFLIHYEQTGWKMNNGGKIANWVAALKNWDARAKRFAERDQQRTAAAKAITGCQAGAQFASRKGAPQETMSEKNRAIYEEELERKRRHRERLDKESEEALSYEEFQALKERLKS